MGEGTLPAAPGQCAWVGQLVWSGEATRAGVGAIKCGPPSVWSGEERLQPAYYYRTHRQCSIEGSPQCSLDCSLECSPHCSLDCSLQRGWHPYVSAASPGQVYRYVLLLVIALEVT